MWTRSLRRPAVHRSARGLTVWIAPLTGTRQPAGNAVPLPLPANAVVGDVSRGARRALAPSSLDAVPPSRVLVLGMPGGRPLDPASPVDGLAEAPTGPGTSSSNPLFVAPAAKTFIVPMDYEEAGAAVPGRFRTCTVASDAELRAVLATFKSSGLDLLDPDGSGGVRFACTYDQLVDGATYLPASPFARALAAQDRWTQLEDKAMEDETRKRMIGALVDELGDTVELPREVKGLDGGVRQEWEGIFFSPSRNTLFLLEAKHAVDAAKIDKIASRVLEYQNIIRHSRHGGRSPYDPSLRLVVVVAGTFFPQAAQDYARGRGMVPMVPTGSRYGLVDSLDGGP
ncbi:hypothetical protein DFJ74DRAFT_210745 [Hyaloraphidium curvatum]|nr:hypothetical protein DFJ74DRAFT_210745 [Hyaloraphidium curvatum]